MPKYSTERVLQSFSKAFGIPRSAISRDFEKNVERTLQGDLIQSSVSEILLGKNKKVPGPCNASHPSWRSLLEKQMVMFDCLETMARGPARKK